MMAYWKKGPLSEEEAVEQLVSVWSLPYSVSQQAVALASAYHRPIEQAELRGFVRAFRRPKLELPAEYLAWPDMGTRSGNSVSLCAALIVAGAGYPVCLFTDAQQGGLGAIELLEYWGLAENQEADFRYCKATSAYPILKELSTTRQDYVQVTLLNRLIPLLYPQPEAALFAAVEQLEELRAFQHYWELQGRDFSLLWEEQGGAQISLSSGLLLTRPQGQQWIQPEALSLGSFDSLPAVPASLKTMAAEAEALLKGKANAQQNYACLLMAALALQQRQPEKSLYSCLLQAEASLNAGRAWAFVA